MAKDNFDFDAALENYDEDAALAELSASLEPKVIVVEGDAVAKFPDGKIYRLALTFSIDDASALKDLPDDDPVEQLKTLFSRLSNEATTNALMKEPFQAVASFASRYFELFQRVNEAAVGESHALPQS